GFLQDVAKTGDGATATVVLLDTPVAPLSGNAFDLASGAPSEGVLGEEGRSEPALWRGHVPGRPAWGSGAGPGPGPGWAGAGDGRGLGALPLGKDEALEDLLNLCAREAYDELDEGVRERLDRYLDQLARPRAARSREALALPEGVLLWRPPGEGRARPAP